MAAPSQAHPGRALPSVPRAQANQLDTALGQHPGPPEPPLPRALTPKALREAIASVLERVRAHDLADECVRFGLPPLEDHEEAPWLGKRRYVDRRIRHWKLPDLLALARDVAVVHDDDRLLNHLITLSEARGADGNLKNLIFAATGPKPRIVLRDAISNDLSIIGSASQCLVYDEPLPEDGLTWRRLTVWWARHNSLADEEEHAVAVSLYRRLIMSMDNDAERFIFDCYCARYGTHGFEVPALIPQVYISYDPYTRGFGGTLTRQRTDFLLLLPRRRRVIIELDGIQHYADEEGRAAPERYAQMVAADRELRLAGYEIYRFGGHELASRRQASRLLDAFFASLLAITK
jgi:hypothetical protein